MSNDFDYQKVLTAEKLLEINNLVDGINKFYYGGEKYFDAYHRIFNSSVYSLDVKHKLDKGYLFGRLCSIGSNKILNVDDQEIFEIDDGIVKFPNALYIPMNKIIFHKHPLNNSKDSNFDIYFGLLSKIENAINKEILSFTNFEFLNKDNEIIVHLRIKSFILESPDSRASNENEKIIEIYNADFNDEAYWKTILLQTLPSIFNGINENDVKNGSTENMLEQLKLLNY